MKCTARHLTNYGAGVATLFCYADQNRQDFLYWFYIDGTGSLYIQVHGYGPVLVTNDPVAATSYHSYKVRYNPATKTADLSVDDVVIHSNWTGIYNQYAVPSSVSFGSGSSAGQGNTNYNKVNFRILPDPIEAVLPSGGITLTEGLTDNAQYDIRVNPDPNNPTGSISVTATPDSGLDLGAGAGAPIVVTFPVSTDPNDLVRTVTVNAVDDALVEGPHFGTIKHTSSSADSVYNAAEIRDVIANIIDNDGSPGIVVSTTGLYVEEGGKSGQFTIVLATPPAAGKNVFVNISPANGQLQDPNDLVFMSSNWSTAQTVVVNAVDDAVVEGMHSSSLKLTVTSGDPVYNGWVLSDISVTIGDNEKTGPTAVLPYAWYRADAGALSATGLAKDGENVIFLADNSGNLRNLNDPRNGGPVYVANGVNGLPCLIFGGTTNKAIRISTTDFGILTQPNTIFIMVMWDEAYTAGDAGLNSAFFDGYASTNRQSIIAARQDWYEFYGGAGSLTKASSSGDRGNTLLHTGLFSANNGEHYINGQLVQSGVFGVGTGLGGLALGARYNIDGNGLNGHITEMICYAGALSESERKEIEKYLLLKWAGRVAIYEHNGYELASTDVSEDPAANTDTYDVTVYGNPTAAVDVTVTPENAQIDLGAGAGNPIVLTFPAGESSTQVVTVTAVDNAISDGPRVVKISHTSSSADSAYNGLTPKQVSVNVADNEQWCGQPGTVYRAGDVNKDCYVNLLDFAMITENWLLCTDPFYPDNCFQTLP